MYITPLSSQQMMVALKRDENLFDHYANDAQLLMSFLSTSASLTFTMLYNRLLPE